MRYAAAVVAIDRGHATDVWAILAGAPRWPAESAFHEYHEELLAWESACAAGAHPVATRGEGR